MMQIGRLAVRRQAACLLPHAGEDAQRPTVLLAGFGGRYDIEMPRVELDIHDCRNRVSLQPSRRSMIDTLEQRERPSGQTEGD